jgi:predicted nucleotidyltransferase component of viral defense system
MLHFETLSQSALDLLIALCADDCTQGFALTGGTALALRYGHRTSIDLDFFTPERFDPPALAAVLTDRFELVPQNVNSAGLSGLISGVKVDFVTYRYPLLHTFDDIAGVRLFSLDDNIAMKLSAVANRGARKDFYDVHRLINELGLPALIEIYQAKFPNHDVAILLRSIAYFDDAEADFDVDSLDGTTWDEVKAGIIRAVKPLL